jgi:hypothetical protein
LKGISVLLILYSLGVPQCLNLNYVIAYQVVNNITPFNLLDIKPNEKFEIPAGREVSADKNLTATDGVLDIKSNGKMFVNP